MGISKQVQEEREYARQFIIDAAIDCRSPMETLDELASFFDGDITDLF